MEFWIVLLEKTQSHYGLWASLDFIEKQQGFTCYNRNLQVVRYLGSNEMYVETTFEEAGYCLVSLKVYFCEMVKLFAEVSDCGRFSYLTRSLKQ